MIGKELLEHASHLCGAAVEWTMHWAGYQKAPVKELATAATDENEDSGTSTSLAAVSGRLTHSA